MSDDNFNQFEQTSPDKESEQPLFMQINYQGNTKDQPILDFLKRTICPFFIFQSFSFVIIVIYIIVFIITLIPHGINEYKKKYHFLPPSYETLSDIGDLDGSKIREKFINVYRWVSAGFLHNDFVHLFSNCFSLLIIGTMYEHLIGTWRYTIIYFLSGILGSLFKLLVDHKNISVGASICICGVLSSTIGYMVLNWRDLPRIFGCENRYFIIMFPILIAFMNVPTLNNDYEDELDEKHNKVDAYGHLGGLIFGFFLTFIFVKPKDEGSVCCFTAKILFIGSIVICSVFALVGFLCFYLMDKYKENY